MVKVRTNTLSLNAHRNMGKTGTHQVRASARLSSGFRINSAADDAAGLAISEKMRAQIRGIDQASRNAQDAISLIQTAEGAISSINDMVIRIRELVIQASNDTNVHDDNNPAHSDRVKIQQEIDQILSEIDAITLRTEFNTRRLLDGSYLATIEVASPSVAPMNIYGGRISQQTIFDFQTQLQNADFDILGPDGFGFWMEFQVNIPGYAISTLINIAWGVLAVEPDFEDFVRYDMFAPDGSVTDENMQHFVDTLRRGLEYELIFNSTYLFPGAHLVENYNLGAHLINVFVDQHGRLGVGFDQSEVSPLFVNTIRPTVAHPGVGFQPPPPGHFNDIFLSLLSDDVTGAFGILPTPIPIFPFGWQAESGQPSEQQGNALWFQIGANEGQGINLHIEAMDTGTLGLRDPTVSVLEGSGYDIQRREIERLDHAISHATGQRAILGAVQNRLEFTIQNLDTASENLSASESRIRDADMAREMMRLTQSNVLQQAAVSMLAQANQAPQAVLQLLG